ncbi:MAG: OmpA family protein [Chthoniobacterales bacterium]|nr:OmpA family protein [Chthoniobacterales bacterium]
MRKFSFHIALVTALGVSLTACSNKKGDLYAGVDGDYVTGTPLGDRVEGANFFGSSVQRGKFPPIQFAYDSYEVSGDELPTVQTVASAMKGSASNLIIAGFTDDRGTDEYNRGLGERRAQSVRQALIQSGVRGDKIQTVSFGKEMPADPGSGESAWAKNRRAEFGVVK